MTYPIIEIKKGKHSMTTPRNSMPLLKKLFYEAGCSGKIEVALGPRVGASGACPIFSLGHVTNRKTVELYVKSDDNGSRYAFFVTPPENTSAEELHKKLQKAVDTFNGVKPQPEKQKGEVRLELEDPDKQPYWFVLWTHNGTEYRINKYPGDDRVLYRNIDVVVEEDPSYNIANKLLTKMRADWERSQIQENFHFRIEKFLSPVNKPKSEQQPLKVTLGDMLKEKGKGVDMEATTITEPESTATDKPEESTTAGIKLVSVITDDVETVNLIMTYIKDKADKEGGTISRRDILDIIKSLNFHFEPLRYILDALIRKGLLEHTKTRGIMKIAHVETQEKDTVAPTTPAVAPTTTYVPTTEPKGIMAKIAQLQEQADQYATLDKSLTDIDAEMDLLVEELKKLQAKKDQLITNKETYRKAAEKLKELEAQLEL